MNTISENEKILCVRSVPKFGETFSLVADTSVKCAPIYTVSLTTEYDVSEICRTRSKLDALEFFYNIFNLAAYAERDGWKELSKYE